MWTENFKKSKMHNWADKKKKKQAKRFRSSSVLTIQPTVNLQILNNKLYLNKLNNVQAHLAQGNYQLYSSGTLYEKNELIILFMQ